MQFNTKKLNNGVTLITVPMADNPAVTALVMVSAGSKYETKDINGLSHFLEHMMFKGTTKRPSTLTITTELDSIGSTYNAFTSQEFTGYYVKASSKHVEKIIDVISDMYLDPIFPAPELEREKGVIIEEIRMYQDLPHRHVQDLFMELMYGNQPAGWNIAGTENTVRSFNRENFVKYRNDHYVASATTVVVSGNIDEKKVEQIVTEKFKNISTDPKKQKEPVKEDQKEPAIKIHNRTTDQTHMVLGVRTVPITHPDVPALNLLATILGKGMSSRLFHKMREELGVCYYIHCDSDLYTDHGLFTISSGVDKQRLPEVLKHLMEELRKISQTPVTAEELGKAREYLLGNSLLGLETSDARAENAGYQYILKGYIETPDEMRKKYEAVTPEKIREVAQKIFVTKNLNLAAVGNLDNADSLKSLLVI